ncbi:Threonine/homoserine/homoserine lactone efflux protein [Pseudomonas sp. 43mfcvi1.1]|uniref:LysE family translocator n=1 Tax=Pseudomonas sp. 43mfcvi1.1 TaxID=1761894 RepID=UPI000D6AA00B|nr:LysE family translocator [Pseudomonas sp. 43mfcvi1.1]PWJ28115.1 threonine/homoserine/homoserine lactone efflux protein [Pseudomonas sp. 43mfcvi1.1]SSB99936.1 Threonine/homoserine/homoserine lactone efflux protein [Pseudomonas sp. 43mfcvi1.1]
MTLSLDLLLGFALFALVTSITPGPNNTMLLASGVNFGFNRTIPHMLGITCGFFSLVLAVGLGLGAGFQTYPLLYTALRYIGAAYLLYLAWKIAHSGPVSEGQPGNDNTPISYWGAAAFQWVNPKAWIMAIGAISTYTPLQGYFFNVLVIAAVFALINLPSVSLWVVCGSLLRNLLRDRRWLRVFNWGMALLLVASLYPLLLESIS